MGWKLNREFQNGSELPIVLTGHSATDTLILHQGESRVGLSTDGFADILEKLREEAVFSKDKWIVDCSIRDRGLEYLNDDNTEEHLGVIGNSEDKLLYISGKGEAVVITIPCLLSIWKCLEDILYCSFVLSLCG